ncbi:hypothetical protein V1T75_11390 [Tenacibaculum sp. FZY0031]|uniref:hypothetical protein n=1 Tax=Tenacibaculum sp. FZY0031 TaxID=3116648 RepID=UPI002E9C8300|nr:hypothetical protein [Tenacibaculum sp. FZY0031]
MKKSFFKLGKVLNKGEQKFINGGYSCKTEKDCYDQQGPGDPLTPWICYNGTCIIS